MDSNISDEKITLKFNPLCNPTGLVIPATRCVRGECGVLPAKRNVAVRMGPGAATLMAPASALLVGQETIVKPRALMEDTDQVVSEYAGVKMADNVITGLGDVTAQKDTSVCIVSCRVPMADMDVDASGLVCRVRMELLVIMLLVIAYAHLVGRDACVIPHAQMALLEKDVRSSAIVRTEHDVMWSPVGVIAPLDGSAYDVTRRALMDDTESVAQDLASAKMADCVITSTARVIVPLDSPGTDANNPALRDTLDPDV